MIKLVAFIIVFLGGGFSNLAFSAGNLRVSNNILQICESGKCRSLQASGALALAIKDEYKKISTIDLFHNGGREVVATIDGENSCSRFFTYDEKTNSFSELTFSDKDICGFKIVNDELISVSKDGPKLRQDIYEKNGDNFKLRFSDDCYGCDQVNRTVYVNGIVASRYLVDGSDNYENRKPIFSLVKSDKAFLYRSSDLKDRTRMYLIKGDKVQLLDFKNDDASMYYINYVEKNGKKMQYWLRCEDLAVCAQ